MRAILFLIIGTSLWGLNFHFAGLVLAEAGFIEGGFWRYFFAVLILVAVNIKQLPSFSSFKENWKGIFSVGAIGLFGFNIFFFMGMTSTSGVNGALIMGINPAITLILSSVLLKTKIQVNHIFGIVIALSGVLFLLLKGHILAITALNFREGDLLVLVSVIFFALHHVWVKKYSSEKVTTKEFTLMSAVICLVCFLIILPFSKVSNVSEHHTLFWVGALGIGCLGTGLAYLFWNHGVSLVGANKAGVYVNLVPLSAGLSASFFGESLQYYHFMSGAIVIFGLVIMQVNSFGYKKDSKA